MKINNLKNEKKDFIVIINGSMGKQASGARRQASGVRQKWSIINYQ
jgi:hypothetical protein